MKKEIRFSNSKYSELSGVDLEKHDIILYHMLIEKYVYIQLRITYCL